MTRQAHHTDAKPIPMRQKDSWDEVQEPGDFAYRDTDKGDAEILIKFPNTGKLRSSAILCDEYREGGLYRQWNRNWECPSLTDMSVLVKDKDGNELWHGYITDGMLCGLEG